MILMENQVQSEEPQNKEPQKKRKESEGVAAGQKGCWSEME